MHVKLCVGVPISCLCVFASSPLLIHKIGKLKRRLDSEEFILIMHKKTGYMAVSGFRIRIFFADPDPGKNLHADPDP